MKWEKYKQKIIESLDIFEFDEKIPSILREARDSGKTIFVAGNGGSAGLADHFVCDLSKGANKQWKEEDKPRFKAICLSTNTGYMTAIANDTDYTQLFKQQLINLGEKGDVVILISSSGNSPNIVNAAEYAKSKEITIIGVTGFTGGKLKELSDYSAHLKSDMYETAEDIHSIFGHFLAVHLRESEE